MHQRTTWIAKFTLLLWLKILLGMSVLSAYAQEFEKNLPPEILHIPYKSTKRPERIIMSFGENTDKDRIITWRSNRKSPAPRIQWSDKVSEYDFYKKPNSKKGESELLISIENDTSYYHSVHLTGLASGKDYVYRVGDGDYWSEWFDISTHKKNNGDEFQFIYLGDAQNDVFHLWSRVFRAAVKTAPSARFIMHVGDLINHSQNEYEWAEWFIGGGYHLASIPQIAVPGNHEYIKNSAGEKIGLSPYWAAQFNVAANSPEGFEDQTYFYDYQQCRIICLDSNKDLKSQSKWLRQVLEENTQHWTIVMFHHPAIAGADERMSEGVFTHWLPLLEEYKVDLVLQGHDHLYARGNIPQESKGTPIYVISVAGRKMYPLGTHPWMRKKEENVQTFQTITVNSQTINYKSYTLNGEIFDEFEILKSEKGKGKVKDYSE